MPYLLKIKNRMMREWFESSHLPSTNAEKGSGFPLVGIEAESIQNQLRVFQIGDVAGHDVQHFQFVVVEGVDTHELDALPTAEIIVEHTHTE